MRNMVLAFMLAAPAVPSGAAGQERVSRGFRVHYDVSVRCAGVFGGAATTHTWGSIGAISPAAAAARIVKSPRVRNRGWGGSD